MGLGRLIGGFRVSGFKFVGLFLAFSALLMALCSRRLSGLRFEFQVSSCAWPPSPDTRHPTPAASQVSGLIIQVPKFTLYCCWLW